MNLTNFTSDRNANFEFHGTEGAAAVSDALVLRGNGPFTIQVTAGLIEWTASSVNDIKLDTATWEEWPDGTVATTTSSVLDGPATAVRFTGAGSWSVIAQKPAAK